MISKNIWATVFFFVALPLWATDIMDPLANYLSVYERDAGDKVYRLTCDLENNGVQAVFLAYSHDIDSSGEGTWTLYLKRGSVYIKPSRLLEDGTTNTYSCPGFNINRYFIGMISELGKWGLLTSEITSGHNGGTQYKAIIIVGDSFKLVDVGSFLPYDPSAPPSTAPSRFPTPLTPTLEILNP